MRYMTASLTIFDYLLWLTSGLILLICNMLLKSLDFGYMTTVMIGLTALIYTAKGHFLGQIFMIIFSILYSLISLTFHYYSEFITYGFMTLPMSLIAAISWLKHPSKTHINQVQTSFMHNKDWMILVILTLVVTAIFGSLLVILNTPTLLVSILSIVTSFVAVYLTYKRSMYYAIAYALNDIVLMILWGYASYLDIHYLPFLICFSLFFIYDLYGYISWLKMTNIQHAEISSKLV